MVSAIDSRLVSQAVNVKCSLLGAIVVLFYDTALKFDDEVKYIWSGRWTMGKVLYILVRYLGFVDAVVVLVYDFNSRLSPKECDVLYKVAMWFMAAGIILCQFVLIMRTYAIWDQHRGVGIYLFLFQCGAIIAAAFFLNESANALLFIPSPAPGNVPCIPLPNGNSAGALYAFVCVVVFDFNVLVLTMLKAFSQWNKDSSPVVHTIYRDGIIYFVVLFTISLANAILMKSMVNSPYFYMLTEPHRVLHTVLTTRIILNVRIAAEKPVQDLDKSCFGDIPTFVFHSSAGNHRCCCSECRSEVSAG